MFGLGKLLKCIKELIELIIELIALLKKQKE